MPRYEESTELAEYDSAEAAGIDFADYLEDDAEYEEDVQDSAEDFEQDDEDYNLDEEDYNLDDVEPSDEQKNVETGSYEPGMYYAGKSEERYEETRPLSWAAAWQAVKCAFVECDTSKYE